MKKFVLIDLESTCDEPQFPRDEMEVIEIGAVVGILTEESLSIIDDFQFFVKPVLHPTLTAFCTRLTGITQQQVDNGEPIKNGLIALGDWLEEHQVTAYGSWGYYDCKQIGIESDRSLTQNPLENTEYINIKNIFSKRYNKRMGVRRAIAHCGLEFEGRPHSGVDDAKNIARLIAKEQKLRLAIFNKLNIKISSATVSW